ncbi:DnaA regulatory inactivator Hda, partial [Pseudomonas aeruginosa]
MCGLAEAYKLCSLYGDSCGVFGLSAQPGMKPIQLPLSVRLRDDATFA